MSPRLKSAAHQFPHAANGRPRLVVLDKLTNQPVTNYYDSAALTWQDCKSIVRNAEIHRLNRSEPELIRYKAWGNHIKQTYASMEEFILKTVFVPPSRRPGGAPPKIVLRANDFPYNLRPELEHWVLWADRTLGEHQIKAVVSEWLHKVEMEAGVDAMHYPEDEDKLLALAVGDVVVQESSAVQLPEWVYWVNPPERQTIPGVWHAHILVNRE